MIHHDSSRWSGTIEYILTSKSYKVLTWNIIWFQHVSLTWSAHNKFMEFYTKLRMSIRLIVVQCYKKWFNRQTLGLKTPLMYASDNARVDQNSDHLCDDIKWESTQESNWIERRKFQQRQEPCESLLLATFHCERGKLIF